MLPILELARVMQHVRSVPWKWTGGVLLLAGMARQAQSRAKCSSNQHPSTLPTIALYQYHTCPFCCKARAFLDYYGVSYQTVEVNPLFRREIKFSAYKKVPFVVAGDVQVNDSSLLISVLRTCMVASCSVRKALDSYAELQFTDESGKESTEIANKYYVMYGDMAKCSMSIDELREERKWREWVDTRLVHTLSPNIYRTPREALQAMDYISQVGSFSVVQRVAAKYAGAVAMFFTGKHLKRKYGLKNDVRQSLYDSCNKWTRAVGKYRKFMGGDKPNLADLAVYGVLSAIEGLDTFNDVMSHTHMQGWYNRVQHLVRSHAGRETIASSQRES